MSQGLLSRHHTLTLAIAPLVVNSGSTGQPSKQIDFTNLPGASGQISASETWFFSLWFRDPTGGPAGFNFADGLRATFCP